MRKLAQMAKRVGVLALQITITAGALSPGKALAASGNVYFSGDITYNNVCMIIVRYGGVMTASADGHQLSSKNAGGQHGTAEIYSLRPYHISVSAPGFFASAPQGGSDNVTYSTTFSGQSLYRGRTFSERSGTDAVRLRSGLSMTRVNVDLEANRTTVFPAGNYTARATVRCE